ncbi:AsmA family protein [soil metagenome]
MTRFARAALIFLAGLIALILVVLVIVINFDWNRARPWLNTRTSEALGRPFVVRGDLALSWEKQLAGPENAQGWRGLIPWPHLVANDVHIGNPATMTHTPSTAPSGSAGSAAPKLASTVASGTQLGVQTTATIAPMPENEMASIAQFSFVLNPLALLEKKIAIPVLRFNEPVMSLRRDASGINNWTFPQNTSSSLWRLELQRVIFSKGSVHVTDALKHADVTVAIDSIDTDPAYGVSWTLHGKFNGEALSGDGKAGAILSLQQQTAPYPIEASLNMGKTLISVEGTLTKPSDLAAVDMRLKVSGVSMARLYALTGMLSPETPPFSTEGHLRGTLNAHTSHWVYENFKGRVGSSDIAGELDYQSMLPRPRLSGTVVSQSLHFADLAPLIGADSNTSKIKRGVAAVQPANKLLPVEAFKTERWTSIDADIHYQAEKIIRNKELPINKLSTNLRLQDGVLSLMPLDFDMAGGRLSANVVLDSNAVVANDAAIKAPNEVTSVVTNVVTNNTSNAASNKTLNKAANKAVNKAAIKATMKVNARHVSVKQLFPTLNILQASVGEINGDASLSATGNSVAALLAGANGEVKATVSHGSISKLLLEEAGLNIGNVILTHLVGDKQIELNCIVGDFGVTNGVMQTRRFMIDTDEAKIEVNGVINAAQEQLDLTIKPDTKGLRMLSLRAPLYVRGSFKQPNVSIDKGVLAMRAGGAIALAAVAPVAALLPLINAGPREQSECAGLLAEAKVKPVAPAPGKTYHRQQKKSQGTNKR